MRLKAKGKSFHTGAGLLALAATGSGIGVFAGWVDGRPTTARHAFLMREPSCDGVAGAAGRPDDGL